MRVRSRVYSIVESAIVIAVLVLIAIIIGMAATLGAQELTVQLSTSPYQHNLFVAQKCPGPQCQYSGPFIVKSQQWGALAVNTNFPAQTVSGVMLSAVVGPGISYQTPVSPGGVRCNGDFHESSKWVAASPYQPKWVVTTVQSLGSVGFCTPHFPSKVQVYRLETGLLYWGYVFVDSIAQATIVGDSVYIPTGTGYTVVDMPTMSIVGTTPTLPPGVIQQLDINGHTYAMTQQSSTKFTFTRNDAPGPIPSTPTPNVGTPTQVPTVVATRTQPPTRTPPTCCDPGAGHPCPGDVPPCHPPTLTRTPSRTPTARPPTATATSTPVPRTPVPGRTVVPVTAVRTPQLATPRPTSSTTPTIAASPSTTASPTPTSTEKPRSGCLGHVLAGVGVAYVTGAWLVRRKMK